MLHHRTFARRRFAFAAPLLAANLLVAGAGAGLAQERPLAERPVPMIRVTGEGSVALAPDMAILTLGVVREAPTAREALSANSEAMAAVLAALKAFEIAERDIQTSGLSIQPRYTYPNPREPGGEAAPRIDGYSVSNTLSVRIRDMARVGAVLDRAVSLGVNSDGGISFTNDDPSAAIAKARGDAMREAIERARTLAQAAGVTLGPVVDISEEGSRPRPVAMTRKMSLDTAEMGVPVQGGENRYSVSVTASFEIAR